MSCFAVIGTKIRFHKRSNDYIHDDLSSYLDEEREKEDKYLKNNERYTVSHIIHGNIMYAVSLVEFPDVEFDMSRFERV